MTNKRRVWKGGRIPDLHTSARENEKKRTEKRKRNKPMKTPTIEIRLNTVTLGQIKQLREEYHESTGEDISLGKLVDIGIAAIRYIQSEHDQIREPVSIRDLEMEYDELIVEMKKRSVRELMG